MSHAAALTAEAYQGFLGIIDDAIELSKAALAEAERAKPAPPQVILTKVASETYARTASALKKTAVFKGTPLHDLRKELEEGGEPGLLEKLEKLASRAAFTIEVGDDLAGELVEKSGSKLSGDYAGRDPKSAAWQQAWDEATEELG